MDQFLDELEQIKRAFANAFGLDPNYGDNVEKVIQFHHDYYVNKAFEATKPRPVKYRRESVPVSMTFSSPALEEAGAERNGYFHRVVDGIGYASDDEGGSKTIPHSWGLVEDAQDGKFYTVDLELITFIR